MLTELVSRWNSLSKRLRVILFKILATIKMFSCRFLTSSILYHLVCVLWEINASMKIFSCILPLKFCTNYEVSLFEVCYILQLFFSSFNVDDEDYNGYEYSLLGKLSEVRIVYLNRFVQEVIFILIIVFSSFNVLCDFIIHKTVKLL